MSLEDELLEPNSVYQMQRERMQMLEDLCLEARELLRISKLALTEQGSEITTQQIETWLEKSKQMIGEED